MRRQSGFEKELLFRIKAARLPLPETEYRFHPKRKWRFDFAYPYKKIAIECEGAVWTRGRHTRGSGFIADCQKYNSAAVMGWIVLRYPRCMIREAIEDIKLLLIEKCLEKCLRKICLIAQREPSRLDFIARLSRRKMHEL